MQILDSGVIYRRTLERMLIGPHDHVLNFPRLDFFFFLVFRISRINCWTFCFFFIGISRRPQGEKAEGPFFLIIAHALFLAVVHTPVKNPNLILQATFNHYTFQQGRFQSVLW